MTTVQINLPDKLAQDAERAGLLSSESLEGLLRERLREQRIGRLFSAMDAMAQIDLPTNSEALSPDAIAEELASMRAERRVQNG